MSRVAALEPKAILRVCVRVLVVLGVLAMHHLFASVADESMTMGATNASSHAVVDADVVAHHAAEVPLLEASAAPLIDMGGCEGAMLLCGAMMALVIAAVTRTHRRGGSLLWMPRGRFRLPHRWVVYLRTPVVMPQARVVCRC